MSDFSDSIKSRFNDAMDQHWGALGDLIINTGRAAGHAMLPDEIEFYLCSLELFDSDRKQCGFMSFVVMPSQIAETHTPLQTVTKTHRGFVTTFSDSFAPVDISLAGNFGRKIRLVADLKDPNDGNSFFKGITSLNLSVGFLHSGISLKSGYGMIKVLQHLLEYSNKTDKNGKPYYLVFSNYAFNCRYVVEVTNFSFSQNVGNNMIWDYNLQMRAVADYKTLLKKWTKLGDAAMFLKTVAANSIASSMTKIISAMIGI